MSKKPLVSIIMGSKTDDSHLEPTYALLDELGVPWEKRVLSAHRNPEPLVSYIKEAEVKGVQVFITAAGLAAALPGVVSAHSAQPVIGVPVPGGPLKGIDALLSIVQMPGGVPVATVGVGSHGSKNAAVLSAEILALAHDDIRERLIAFRAKQSKV